MWVIICQVLRQEYRGLVGGGTNVISSEHVCTLEYVQVRVLPDASAGATNHKRDFQCSPLLVPPAASLRIDAAQRRHNADPGGTTCHTVRCTTDPSN